MDPQFNCPIEKMRSAGLSDAAVKGFQKAYRKVQGGADELIRESSIETVNEVKRRAKRVKEELQDVVDELKDVGNQLGDVGAAVKGKPRRGRKPKAKK